MPRIYIQCNNFPPRYGIYNRAEEFSWDDILWAAITIGRANWLHVFQHGNASLWEAICRVAMVRMTLRTDWNIQYYYYSKAFKSLDPTEKGAVSYFIGMIMCKLFAERMLQVPWLMHLDVYRSQISTRLLSGRSRPDLIGRSPNGDWIVFESKGRSSGPSRNDKQRAKMQAMCITEINGQPVRLNMALFSYYRNNRLQVYCEDPDSDRKKGIQLKINIEDLVKDYYQPVLRLLGSIGLKNNLETEDYFNVEEVDFSIRIERGLLKYLLQEDYRAAYEYLVNKDKGITEKDSNGYKIDGMNVKAGESWKKLNYSEVY